MIHSFTFKNFCSFADKTTISFEDIRKGLETKSNMFADTPSGTRLSKVMVAIGPNASGKTSALKALAFLGWFVRFSFVGLEGDEIIPVNTFEFSENEKSISEFELVFEYKSRVYKYILHLYHTHVVKEELYRKEKSQHFNYLFKRNCSSETERSKISISQRLNLKTEVVEEILRNNVSLIAASVAIKNDLLTEIADFWKNIISNVNRKGKIWGISYPGSQGLFEAAETYNKNQNLFKKVVQFLRDIDLGLDDVKLHEREIPNKKTEGTKKVYVPYGIHKVNKKQYKLPFILESSGTRNMFVLLRNLLPVIEEGGVAIIDELEIDLHPHALPQIIELFTNPATNPKNSQLLFTSHSLEVLSHLEKEQIILVQKNRECKSELYRLDELKGVRRDDNIYAKYMAGAYGAVPNI